MYRCASATVIVANINGGDAGDGDSRLSLRPPTDRIDDVMQKQPEFLMKTVSYRARAAAPALRWL